MEIKTRAQIAKERGAKLKALSAKDNKTVGVFRGMKASIKDSTATLMSNPFMEFDNLDQGQ